MTAPRSLSRTQGIHFHTALWLLCAMLAPATCWAQDDEDAVPMKVSADGSYVADPRLRLAWARCVEGMGWNGKTCTGTPLMLDRAEARSRAAERAKAEGADWRLPRAPELQHFFKRPGQKPGLDAALFPAAPPDWHWTSTTDVKSVQQSQYTYGNVMQSRSGTSSHQMSFLHGWAVNLRTGESRKDVGKDTKLPVRLVRSLTEQQ